MKRKILAMLLSVALIFAIFGTLAVAAEENAAQPTPEVCTCGTQDGTHAETCALYVKPETQQTPVCTCGTQDGTHAETCALYVKPETQQTPVCTCGTEDGTHAETCALYAKPEAQQAPVCTCGTQDGTHAETCALYVKPEVQPAPEEKKEDQEEKKEETPAEPAPSAPTCTCSDTCETQDCPCLCHIVAKLLATTNVQEFYALAETLTQEQLETLTQEQLEQISAHLASIEPQPAPPIVLEESEPPVESEIYTPTKNYTNVAPFGDPVTGK